MEGTPALRTLPVTDWSCTDAAMALAMGVITLGVRRCKSQAKNAKPHSETEIRVNHGVNYYVKCLSAIKTQKRQAKLPFKQL